VLRPRGELPSFAEALRRLLREQGSASPTRLRWPQPRSGGACATGRRARVANG